jgi:DNA-binding CsgD family transcriptional regulator
MAIRCGARPPALGDARAARRLADAELERARAWKAPRVLGRALRIAAETRHAREALPLLRDSQDVLATSAARLERARTEVALGVALARLGDRSSARDALWRGLEDANICRAQPLTQHAHHELVRAGARPRRMTRSGAAALTPTERRVAELAAQGRTNRETAEALFVTPKTIEMHLRNAFRKLQIQSRTQLHQALSSSESESVVD